MPTHKTHNDHANKWQGPRRRKQKVQTEQGQRNPVGEEKRVSPLSRVGESQDGEEHGQAQLLTEGKNEFGGTLPIAKVSLSCFSTSSV